MSTEQIRDLRERLMAAKNRLFELESQAHGDEQTRLAGKREGVTLALSYTEEYLR